MKILKKLKETFRKRLDALRGAECEKKLFSSHRKLVQKLYQAKIVEKALNVGDMIPLENLQDCFGSTIDVRALLEKGPLVIKFYRGSWCPFCSADLQFLHEHYDVLTEAGATALAISTQLAEVSAEVTRQNGYKFHVIADTSTEIARKFGLVFTLTEDIAQAYKTNYGIDLLKYHPHLEAEISLPATYVVSQSGEITYAFLDEDFRKRADIDEVVHFTKKSRRDKRKYLLRCEEESCLVKNIFANVKKSASQLSSLSGSWSFRSRERISISSSSEYEKDPLKYCLENEVYLNSFKEYLNKTFCTENLLFYLEATQFQDAFPSIKEPERKEIAEKIIETFVKVGADLEINIDDLTREELVKSAQEGSFTFEMFSGAAREVYVMLQNDSFLKWKRTLQFRELWQRQGSPEFLSPTPELARAA